MLAAPVSTSNADSGLDLVKDEQYVIFIAERAKQLKKFTAKMVIPSLTLDRFNDNSSDMMAFFGKDIADLFFREFLLLKHCLQSLLGRERKIDRGVGNSWPGEFGKQICFSRVRVGEVKGEPRPPRKATLEVNVFFSIPASTSRHIFANFPIHGGF